MGCASPPSRGFVVDLQRRRGTRRWRRPSVGSPRGPPADVSELDALSSANDSEVPVLDAGRLVKEACPLARGANGVVYKALYDGMPVVVKVRYRYQTNTDVGAPSMGEWFKAT